MTASTLTSDNGASSGTSGIKYNGGTDGTLQLQTTTSGGTATTAVTIDNSQNTTLAGYLNAPNTFGFKNRIINGAMVIDQRNAGASVTPANNTYTLDRWKAYQTTASKFSVQQNAASVTLPAGYTNYLGVTSLSAYTVATTDFYTVQQVIEGYNTSDLAWGTAAAKTVTLSFLVYSSLTGTFGGSIFNLAGTRSYPFNYSIASANTWITISVTIPGDTTGSWLTGTNAGIQVAFGLGAGSTYTATANAWAAGLYTQPTSTVSVVGTNGATFYITGVQLEKGSTATSFDYRPYGTELALCQRYFLLAQQCIGGLNQSGNFQSTAYLPVVLRASPSISYTGTMNFDIFAVNTYYSTTQPSSITYATGTNMLNFVIAGLGATSSTGVGRFYGQNLFISAEL